MEEKINQHMEAEVREVAAASAREEQMKLDCKNCGAMVGHWLVVEVPAQESGSESHYKCVCRQCGAAWREKHHPLKGGEQRQGAVVQAPPPGPEAAEAFGVLAPPEDYYLHRSHAWAALESSGEVRVGLDDFSQKILGPADALKLPAVGAVFFQDHICMSVIKKDNKASFEAPVDGIVTEVNPEVCKNPRLLHDDPYGKGWLFKVKPTNLRQNLANLLPVEKTEAWIAKEACRLLNLMESTVGVTLPSGGSLIGDIYDHYPQLGWRRLVKEFFLSNVTRHWKKKG
jgi:glycine cleavage system H lipoate-binding protein